VPSAWGDSWEGWGDSWGESTSTATVTNPIQLIIVEAVAMALDVAGQTIALSVDGQSQTVIAEGAVSQVSVA